MTSRFWTTAETIVRASSAADGSPVSASWRSRIASAVCWPKSASKIAASAIRRPARRPRCRSAADAIDDDGDGAELQPEQPLDRGADRHLDLVADRDEGDGGPGDDP